MAEETTTPTPAEGARIVKRALYNAGNLSHDEYFGWLAAAVGAEDWMLPCGLERVRASDDPYLNDVALRLWDAGHKPLRQRAAALGMAWSQSDTVCTLKAYARFRAQGLPLPEVGDLPAPPRRSLLGGQDVSPEAARRKLDETGERLASLFDLRRRQGELLEELWKRYLEDCRRYGVRPCVRREDRGAR